MNSNLKDGDVVWKKWENFFWPCIYCTIDKIPGGDKLPTRYVAAVKYFGTNEYEFLIVRTKVYPYNCEDKHLFIKKGVNRHQKSGDMSKFLQDVRLAEAATYGNKHILSLPEFQLTPQKKNCVTLTPVKELVSTDDSVSFSSSQPDTNTCHIKDNGPIAVVKHCDDKRRRLVMDEPETTSAENSTSKRIKLGDDSTNVNAQNKYEDDDSSDDDTVGVSALNGISNNRDKNFIVDQIVLVPWRKVYYPAFVTKVIKKKKKDIVYIRYVNSPRHEKAFRKNANCVLDFRDSKRNQTMCEAAASVDPSSIQAYDRCVQYLSIRSNRMKDLSALRFLTRHPNDLQYGVIPDSELHVSVDELCLDSQNGEDDEALDEPETSEDDVESEEEIIAPFAVPCDPNTELSKDELLTAKNEASKLLEVIKTDTCLQYLHAILNGDITSWRHSMFCDGTKEERDNLRGSSGFGVFYDKDQSYELLTFLRENLPRIVSVDKSKYMLNVWLPEAMLYALMKVHAIDQSEAERRLRATSCLSEYIEYLRK